LSNYINDITEFPKCEVCGEENKRNIITLSLGYNLNVCSLKCSANHPDNKEQKKQTTLKNYGVENPAQSKEIQEKYKSTCIQKFGVDNPSKSNIIKEQKKQTTLLHYGVENPMQSAIIQQISKQTTFNRLGVENASQADSIKEKKKQTSMKHYGILYPIQSTEIKDKMEHTMFDKYGVKNASQSIIIKAKKKATCLQNYGVDHPLKSPKIKEKIKFLYDSGATQEKIYKTKKANNSLGKSKEEDMIYELLLQKYPDAIHHHKDENYPFVCDFFIPSTNTYIELNFTWMHGESPYIGSPEQLDMIKSWSAKSKEINSKGKEKTSYRDAIHIWTERDPMKISYAIKNNLDFLCFYDKQCFLDWFNLSPSSPLSID